ncbi:hypothetical protein V8C35DRAFT_287958 [Trichoderma chlorosporum]
MFRNYILIGTLIAVTVTTRWSRCVRCKFCAVRSGLRASKIFRKQSTISPVLVPGLAVFRSSCYDASYSIEFKLTASESRANGMLGYQVGRRACACRGLGNVGLRLVVSILRCDRFEAFPGLISLLYVKRTTQRKYTGNKNRISQISSH